MCLAIPAEVVEIFEDETALIEFGGAKRKVSLALVDGVGTGDFVLVHAGFAIEVVDEEEARKTMELLEQLAGFDEVR
jgi:hydrogenase expression/formation protein HypC